MIADVPPLIGVPACLSFNESLGEGSRHEDFAVHQVGHKYVTGVIDGAGGLAVLIPALGARLERRALLDRLDGLLITGSRSNVEPHHYGGPPAGTGSPADLKDPARDATTLPLIRDAIALGVPLFAICRGIQELNVALGGTLHQEVHALPGRIDHRSDKSLAMHERYEAAHRIALTPGGVLQTLLEPLVGRAAEIEVNSLHGQAIDRLAPRLAIEARAADGTIEAVSVQGASTFALGVQWHPEWRVQGNPVSARLFAAFGAACRARAGGRARHDPRVRHDHGAMAAGA